MINRRHFLAGLAASAGAMATRPVSGIDTSPPSTSEAARPLHDAFLHPPDSARPWVYWFWVNGNVTKEGITADLEAMQRVGIGGVLIMEVDPYVPPGPVEFASRQWHEMLHFACAEASRLSIEINLYNAAGWAGSGGPWITPEFSMQKVVWSELELNGPRHFEGALPEPEKVLDHYRDVAILAFPTPGDDSYRIENIQIKATFDTKSVPYDSDHGLPPLPISFASLPRDCRIDQKQILDLTSSFKDDRLTWDVPAGKWTLLRFGHTSTGVDNHPTSKGGRGLECDKLRKEVMDLHFSQFLGKVVSDLGPLAGKTLVSTHIDSWEIGAQNWTTNFAAEFKQRRGYDIFPFFPAITGRVVGDLELSERFLWDFRKTISDLMLENYAGRLRELAHARGMRLSIEAYDGDFCDEMGYASQADEPQGEFWFGRDYFPDVFRSWQWCSNMVSTAHVYGKKIIAAESFTAMPGEDWLAHPASLKPLADWALCAGINRLVVHRYAMQPWLDRAPGMTMGPFGVHYERTQTWWEQSKPWHEYLTRCQFLLRQGLFVADICYLQPEGAPMRFRPPGVDMRSGDPPTAPGHNFDGCTAEVVLTRMSVKDGNIVLPDGMSYRLLVLPEPGDMPGAGTMTPQLLQKIAELVGDGMILVGPPPSRSPSLTQYPECDGEVERIANQLWADLDGVIATERNVGKGRVIWGKTPQEVLAAMGIRQDFSSQRSDSFRYIHRRTEDGTDLYFLANKKSVPVEEVCTFRAIGRPEFWWPETGEIERPAIYGGLNGCIRMPIRLRENESVFVIFPTHSSVEADRIIRATHDGRVLTEAGEHIQVSRRADGALESIVLQAGPYMLRAANGRDYRIDVPALPESVTIPGPWDVHFAPNWGATAHIELPKLISWTEHKDLGIRHFSGSATYRKEIHIPAAMLDNRYRLFLDLGEVQVIASVALNQKNLGDLWKPPFRLDITEAARPGLNVLELTVVNLWPNRLIGDANLPDDSEWEESPWGGMKLQKWPSWLLEGKPSPTGRFTFATYRPWGKDASLLRSGLLGPVNLSCACLCRNA